MTGQGKVVDVTAQSSLLQGSTSVNSVADLLPGIGGDGDPKAWDEIYRRYSRLVSTTVRSFHLQEADALDAVQRTWLRLAEDTHRVQYPERLGGWLVITARRVCLDILRQAKHAPDLIDVTPETVTDPSGDPEQHVIDAETTRTLRKLIAELSPRHQVLLRALFTDHSSYAEAAHATGIPLRTIGPTRSRALQQLRRKLDEHELGSETAAADDVEEEAETTEGDRTGSRFLDNLLDKAEQTLREKLEPKVTDLRVCIEKGTGDAQLDDLLHTADAALRSALMASTTASRECLRILRQQAQRTPAPPHAVVEQLADPLNMLPATVRSNLRHGRKTLRRLVTIDTQDLHSRTAQQLLEAFQRGDDPLPAYPRPQIHKAWKRAKASNVDPAHGNDVTPHSWDEVNRRRCQSPLAACWWELEAPAELGKNTEQMTVVVDAHGVMLWRGGDRRVLRRADELGFVERACWDIENAGASGIALALMTGQTVTVCRYEHYVEAQHDLSCVAAPVRDLRDPKGGRPLCVLNLTGTQPTVHHAILREIDTIARRVGRQLPTLWTPTPRSALNE